jgi:hypothetical protein
MSKKEGKDGCTVGDQGDGFIWKSDDGKGWIIILAFQIYKQRCIGLMQYSSGNCCGFLSRSF